MNNSSVKLHSTISSARTGISKSTPVLELCEKTGRFIEREMCEDLPIAKSRETVIKKGRD